MTAEIYSVVVRCGVRDAEDAVSTGAVLFSQKNSETADTTCLRSRR